jgi:N-acetylglucosaminyldiphosphoundecaprenol N-acetyl-beta-D-mannosaminyltransferase
MGIRRSHSSNKRSRILGVPYDNVTVNDAIELVERFVRDEESHTIVHLSLVSLMRARRDKNLRIFLEEADLIVPCGRYIYWAAKVLKRPLKEYIDPSQFVKLLMIQSVELGKRVYLFGGKGDTIEKAYDSLKKDIPKLFVVGKYRGNYERGALENVVTAIGKASPDYFFIGLGSPREEIWIERYIGKINAGVIVLVEGLFNLYAGKMGKHRKFTIDPASGWLSKREIPHPRSFKKLWLIPSFTLSVIAVRLFWRH